MTRDLQARGGSSFDVVALVASAGGLHALRTIIDSLPRRFPAAVLVAQHLGRSTSTVADILGRTSRLPVNWAEEGAMVRPGRVWVGPPRQLFGVRADRRCSVCPRDERKPFRYSLDFLLQSIADNYGAGALAVILTGAGSDGTAGALAVHKAGGTVLVQNSNTAEQPGMPRAAICAGAADEVLSLAEIGPAVIRTVGRKSTGRVTQAPRSAVRFYGDGTAARRDRFRLALADTLRPLTSPVDLRTAATRLLAEHLAARRVMFAEAGPDGEPAVTQCSGNLSRVSCRYGLDDFGPTISAALVRGKTIVVDDLDEDPEVPQQSRWVYAGLRVHSHVTVPVVTAGRLMAFLSVHMPAARTWTDEEVELVEETAEQTWIALNRQRTETALREAEAKYRPLFELVAEGFCVIERVEGQSGDALDFRYVEANPAFEAQFAVGDVVGKSVRQTFPDRAKWLTCDAVLRTGTPTRFLCKSRAYGRLLECYAFRIEDDTRKRVAMICTEPGRHGLRPVTAEPA